MKRTAAAVIACVIALAVCACGGHHKAVPSSHGSTTATRATPAQAPAKCSPQDQTMNCVLAGVPAPPGLRPQGTATQYGVDFGWSGVSAARARQLGARFGASYLSADSSKNWTASLVNAYHAAGLGTVAVWETSATRSEQGRSAGIADAKNAAAQAAALGNTNRPILFAIDCDCAGGAILAYFQGAQSVLHSRVDAYGGYDQISYLRAHRAVGSENWQTYAWSGGRWLPASIAPLEQYLNGSAFDNDRALAPNYGQWPAAKVTPDVIVIGGAEHYENYPASAPARPNRERPSVQGWDSHGCENPVRRPVCKITRAHLLYDLGRDQALYAHDSKTLRNELHLPGRIQGIVHRLTGRGVVRRWL